MVVAIGLSIAVVAGYVLLMSGPIGGSRGQTEAPHGEIGEESRARLREILREADREER
jgi:hypothetical protein